MCEGHVHCRRWLGMFLTVVAITLFTGAMVLPVLKASNCGGNSAALAACGEFVAILKVWIQDNPGEVFHYDTAGPERTKLAGEDWVRSARFLAKRSVDPAGPKQIVVVCDRAYANVPQGVLWKAPMAHAVGYSTGTTGLISPSEFAQLNLDEFAELRGSMPAIVRFEVNDNVGRQTFECERIKDDFPGYSSGKRPAPFPSRTRWNHRQNEPLSGSSFCLHPSAFILLPSL